MKSEKEKLIKNLYEGCKDIKVNKSNDFKCETPIAKVIKICEENKKEIEKQIKRSLVIDECIYKLQEEKDQLQKRFNHYQDRKIEENADLIKRLDIADKKLTVFSRELEQANKENEQLKEENKHYKQIAQHHGDMSIKYTNKCAKYKQILQDIKTLVTKHYLQNKRQLVQNYDCLDNFMQKIEDKCSEVLD